MKRSRRPKIPKGATKKLPIDRQFPKDFLQRATAIVKQYHIVMWFEDGEWYGRGLELPHTYGDGKTPAACIASVREGLFLTVATMLEDGDRPPTPARAGERNEQVNVRLSTAERAELEYRARAAGFKGIADFVRTAALAEK